MAVFYGEGCLQYARGRDVEMGLFGIAGIFYAKKHKKKSIKILFYKKNNIIFAVADSTLG